MERSAALRRQLIEVEVDGEIAEYEGCAPDATEVTDEEREAEIERRLSHA